MGRGVGLGEAGAESWACWGWEGAGWWCRAAQATKLYCVALAPPPHQRVFLCMCVCVSMSVTAAQLPHIPAPRPHLPLPPGLGDDPLTIGTYTMGLGHMTP